MINKIRAIIFDLGGVLIDWNPEYLYRKIFASKKEMDYFLSSVCTSKWNEEQDGGRSLQEGTELVVKKFPRYENEIRAYYGRWDEMLGGVIEDTAEIFRDLKRQEHLSLYALTNWSAETIPIAIKRYEFFQWFDGIVVSGKENTRKPFPEIYRLIIDRYNLSPPETLFIDDNLRNVKAAEAVGLKTIHFTSPEQLKQTLKTSYSL